mgnify:FL=1
MGKKEDKQFPLTSKDNCAVYLNRIISSCELCMVRLKKYNTEGNELLAQYEGKDVVPHEIYAEILDKSSNVIDYLLNLLGDAQTSSISYFKFRSYISKHPVADVMLNPLEDDIRDLLNDFNRMRNWQNHVPESLLVAEMEQVKAGKMEFPMDPVDITIYRNVTYDYFKDMVEINISFYNSARKIIQRAKKDYRSIYGKSVTYNRVYVDSPLGFDKIIPTKKSAQVQGIKGNIGLGDENKGKQ